MDVNNLLPAELWLQIAETSPQAYVAVRSINKTIRSYTNDHIDLYVELFSKFKIETVDGFTNYYRELPNGKIHGLYTRKNPDGNIILKCYYDSGVLQGRFTTYYDDGSISTDCFYENGFQEGEYDEYDYDGEITSCYHYEKGECIRLVYHNPTYLHY